MDFTRVRITLSRGTGTALDTTVDFPPGADSLVLALEVQITGTSETFGLTLEMINAAGDTVFRGGPVPVTATAGAVNQPAPVSVTVRYVGVGSNAASVRIQPRAAAVFFGDTTRLTATALDSSGEPIPGTPVVWQSLNANIAQVVSDTSGKVIAGSARGIAHIEAALLTEQADTVPVTVEPVPSTLTVLSGGSQTGAVGTALPQPVTVRVKAVDGVGVAGVVVTFAVTGGGGTVTNAVDTTDANGDVSTSWTLGGALGTQTLSATVPAVPGLSATISATGVVGPPKRLAFLVQPSTVAANAVIAPAPQVAVQDSFGNTVTGFSGSVTLALGANPGGASLGGTLTVAAAAGVATFGDLKLDQPGAGYTLVAGASGLSSATSAAFNVSGGVATQLAFVQQPTGAVAGAAIAPPITVEARDANGNAVPSFTGNVTVAITGGTGTAGATLSGTKTMAAVAGVATFGGLAIDKAGTGYTLSASASGLAGATSAAFDITAGGANQLAFTTQPATTTAGVRFGVVVTARDPQGNTATSFTGNVTVAITPGTGTPGAALRGTATVAAVAGVASFSGLSVDSAGSGYTLAASATGLAGGTSTAFAIAAAPATRLAFTTQPPNTTAGAPFGVAVTARDSLGNTASAFTGNVTVGITGGTGKAGATLRGTTTVAAVAGVATFGGLSVDSVGTGYSLTATATGPSSGISASFDVAAALANRLAFTTQPASTTAGTRFGVVVTARDSLGNTATSFTGNVTVAITGGTGKAGATLRGTTAVAAVAGVATFSGLSVDSAGTGYTLTATASGASSASSSVFDIAAAPASQLVFATEPPASSTAGSGFGAVVTARDSLGNTASAFAGTVTVAITAGTGKAGAALRGTTAVAAVAGVAAFAGLSVDSVGTGYTLTAAATGPASAVSSQFAITAAPASRLVFTTEPPVSSTAGIGFGAVVTARDSLGNTASAFAGTVTVAITAGTGKAGAALRGTTTVAAVAGVATFSGLGVDSAATGYTLTATAAGPANGTSSQFAITAAPASRLAFTSEPPTSVAAGTAFSVVVAAQDSVGNTVTSFTGSVAVAISTNPASGTLSGTLSRNAVSGVATFTGLSIDNIGSGYVLSATGLGTALSTPFNVVASGNVNAWINTAGGNWSVATNWSKGTVPTATDAVTIAQSGTYTVNVDANAAFARLDVGAPTGIQTVSVAANTLTAGNGAFAANTVLNLSGSGTITGGGTLAVAGAFNWTGGNLGGTSGAGGAIQVLAGGTLTIAPTANVTLQAYTVQLAGTGTWTGTATVNSGSGAVLRVASGATLDIQGDPNFAFSLGGATPLFDDQGTVKRTTSLNAAVIGVPMTLAGALNVQSGLMTLVGGGTLSGAVTLAGTTVLELAGGTFSLANNFRETGATALTVALSGATLGGLTAADTAFFDNLQLGGGAVSLSGGTIKTPVQLIWNQTTSVSGGTLYIPTGAALNLGLLAPATLANATILNAGSAAFTTADTLHSGSGAVIRNLPGATFAFTAPGSYLYDQGGTASLFDNQGTLAVAPTTGAAVVSAQFSNTGTVQVASDTLRLAGGSAGTFPGALTVTSGAVLELGGGTFTQGSPLTVGGNLLVSGGLLVPAGYAVAVTGNFATSGTGALQMTNAADSMEIGGNATFGGGTGTLSNGVIRVAGNFTQTGGASFAPGPNTSPQRVVLTGSAPQTISFANPTASFFRRLQSAQGANGAITLTGVTRAGWFQWIGNNAMAGTSGDFIADTITGSAVGSNITVNKVEVSSVLNTSGSFSPDTAVFTGVNQVIPNLYAYHTIRVAQSGGTATFAANPTAALANLVVSSGTLDLTGRQVAVTGLFRTEGTGALRMTGASDSLGVGGNVTFSGGSTTGLLSGGVMTVGGSFAQTGTADAFAPSTAERVVFGNTAGATQTISFANPTGSFFDSLVVDRGQGPRGTVQLLTDIRVNRGMTIRNASDVTGATARATIAGGALSAVQGTTSPTMTNLAIEVSTAPLIGGSPVMVSPDTMVYDGAITSLPTGSGIVYHSVRVNTLGTMTVPGAITIPNDLVVSSGGLSLNRFGVAVAGNFRTEGSGVLVMTSPTDNLVVSGNVTFGGGSTAGLLTSGLITLGGNFVQTGSGAVFAPSGTHRVTFARSAAGTQTIQFADPAGSFFWDLLLNRPGVDTVRLLSNIQAADSAIVSGSSVLASTSLEALTTPTAGVLRVHEGGVLRASRVAFGTLVADSDFTGSVRIFPDTAVFLNGGTITSSSPAYGWKSVRLAGGTLTSSGTTFQGNLIVSGGTYSSFLFGTTDSVAGFLRTEGTGVFQMPTGTQGATVVVGDSAVFAGGSEAGQLTQGTLRLYGDFVQRGSTTAFQASGTHTTQFAGATPQTVTFVNPGASLSTFNNLLLARASGGLSQVTEIVLGSPIFVAGIVQDTSAAVADTVLGGGNTVTTAGLDLLNTIFSNAPVVVTNSTQTLSANGLTFANMSPTAVQLTMSRGAGTFTLSGVAFLVAPTGAGKYFSVTNTVVGAANTFSFASPVQPPQSSPPSSTQYTKAGATLPIVLWGSVTLP